MAKDFLNFAIFVSKPLTDPARLWSTWSSCELTSPDPEISGGDATWIFWLDEVKKT